MSFFSALRRKPEEEDLYEDYEESYAYEDEGQDWASEGVQPIHSVADMQIVLVAPQEYKDASKIASPGYEVCGAEPGQNGAGCRPPLIGFCVRRDLY